MKKKIREVIIKIRDVYRVKGRNINDSVVIATAYVLARSKRDISVSTRSLESFVKTADISSKAAGALERILGTSWDIVLECENKFDSEADTAECLKAAVVYYDLAEMHDRPLFFSPASLVNLASRILDIKATDKVLDICSGIGQFPIYAINETVSMIIFSKNNRSVRLINAEDLVSKSETRGNQNYLSDDDIGKILDRLEQSGTDGLYTIDLSPADMEEGKYDLMAYHYLDKGGRAFGLMMESIIRGSQIKSEALEQYKSDKPTKYRYITLSNIVNGSVEIEEGKQYLTELPEALKKFVIPDDSIVLSKMASPTFRSAVISSDNKCRCIATGNLYIIKLKTNNNIGNSEKRIAPNPYYIQAYLESAEGEAALERVSGGTSLKTISVEAVKNILIPNLPPEEEEEVAREYCQAQEEYNVLKRLMKTVLVKKRTLLENRLEHQRRKDESADGQ